MLLALLVQVVVTEMTELLELKVLRGQQVQQALLVIKVQLELQAQRVLRDKKVK